jgi:hypothetical protein
LDLLPSKNNYPEEKEDIHNEATHNSRNQRGRLNTLPLAITLQVQVSGKIPNIIEKFRELPLNYKRKPERCEPAIVVDFFSPGFPSDPYTCPE